MTTTMIRPHLRWAIVQDIPQILAIERASFEFPWTEKEFIRCLRQRDMVAMVAEVGDQIGGYCVYERDGEIISLANLAVVPHLLRLGIGARMVDELKSQLSLRRQVRIVCEIRESNLSAQLFFKAMGFRAVAVLRDFYEDSPEDAYQFHFVIPRRRRRP